MTDEEEALCVEYLGERDEATGCFNLFPDHPSPITNITALYLAESRRDRERFVIDVYQVGIEAPVRRLELPK